MENVLVVDDDPEVRRFLHDALAKQGYHVTEAATAGEAEAAFEQAHPVITLLDLGLPDRDGLELLHALRTKSGKPIIILSARESDEDKVTALDSGADDYLTKPCSSAELLARIRVALRHQAGITPPDEPRIEVGPIVIDQARHEVTVDGTPVRLTPIEFRLLLQLARRSGKVMTHRQLLEAVWGAGKETQTHYLRVHMQALRRKIERDPSRPRWLATEPGIGYRLRDE
ncbi:MAG TPA: response regulator transcription factor [Kofleriaceae bacterium]|nr:response regulator transcription factor [Kofleriaceae bacterium]